jgi:methylmalonyl-CoA mutase N-terminal domain/subunit
MMDELKKAVEEWRARHGVEGTVPTDGGLEVKGLYTPQDLADRGFDYMRDLGLPGEWPYTRGIDPHGYRKQGWVRFQYAGRAGAGELNAFLKRQLAEGVTGLDVAVDLPTQIGVDSDHPLALGEVGKVGVPLCSLRDMENVFDGIDVSRVHVTIQTNSQPFMTLAYLIALCRKQGGDTSKLSSFFQNDILKEFIARGTHIFPPAPSMRLTTDVILYCADHQPHISPQMVCEYHMRDAGSTPIESLAMMFGDAIAYADAVIARGGSVERYLKQLYIFITANHRDFFEEVARLRATRRMWAKLWRDRYGVTDPELLKCRMIEFQTGTPLPAQDAENNIIRIALSVMAGAMGGVQVMGPRTYDEALGIPSDQALRLSLRAQQIVGEESGIANVVDPLGGSYYVESLTDEIERRTWAYLARIEEQGGMVRAIEKGWVQAEISRSACENQRDIESGRRVVVGVNRYATGERPKARTYRPDPELVGRQIAALEQLRKERDGMRVARALERLEAVARTDANIVPATVEAVEAYATIGEICGTLRKVFGEHADVASAGTR